MKNDCMMLYTADNWKYLNKIMATLFFLEYQ